MWWGVATICGQSLQTGQDSTFEVHIVNPNVPLALHFVLLSVSELESALTMDPAAFRALYSAEKPKLEDKNLVFFCQLGKRGSQATQLAQGLGYTGYDKA